MKVNYDHIDLIERYLDDELSEEELVMFSEKLDQDPNFNKLYFEMDQLLEGIRRSAKESTVDEKLAKLEMALPVRKKIIKNDSETPIINLWSIVMRNRIAVAAMLSLLIVSALVLTNINNGSSPETLFVEYYQPFENQAGAKRSISDKEKLDYAMMEYDKGNYDEAIEIFEEIEIKDENRIQIWMYGGITYLELDKVEKAIENFQNIIQTDSEYELEAKWYLSMCYLKTGEKAQAKPLLEEIKESGHGNFVEATDILIELQ